MKRSLLAIAGLVAAQIACGPPSVVDSESQVDAFMARGNHAYACVGLTMRDDHIREYTAKKLIRVESEEAATCMCDALYDAEEGTWDKLVAETLRQSHREDLAACLAKAVDDGRVEDRDDLVQILGDTLAPSAFEALETMVRQSEDVALRASAAKALRASPEHFDFLTTLLSGDGAPEVRAGAAKALAGRAEKGRVRALVTAARKDADASVRRAAIEMLSDKKKDGDVIEAMCDLMMDDEDPSVRAAAITLLDGTKSSRAAKCLIAKLESKEDDGAVRQALLDTMESSPLEAVSEALCDELGPWTKRYIDKLYTDIPGHDIVRAQNNNHWEASYECVRKALARGGYGCYARNYLASWFNELGGSATPPWCPGMVRR